MSIRNLLRPYNITPGIKMMPMRNKKPQMPEAFWAWLDAQLDTRGWSDRELADNAGIANSVISKARSGIQPIGYDACKAIGTALGVTDEFILRLAGLINKPTGWTAERDEWAGLIEGEDENTIRRWTAAIRAMKEKPEKAGDKRGSKQ